MFNNKFISIGVIAVVVLTVIYLGNMVMSTTPPSDALGTYQYKVESVGGDLEKILNDYAKDGWEYVGPGSEGHSRIIFKKK